VRPVADRTSSVLADRVDRPTRPRRPHPGRPAQGRLTSFSRSHDHLGCFGMRGTSEEGPEFGTQRFLVGGVGVGRRMILAKGFRCATLLARGWAHHAN